MKNFYYYLLILVILLISSCKLEDNDNFIIIEYGESITVRMEKYEGLVKHRCIEDELVDRQLLQQTWYYSQDFYNFSYVFGQTSFSLYEDKLDQGLTDLKGAYCIEGNNIHVRYFKKEFIPGSADINKERVGVRFNEKLSLLNEETIQVVSLDRNKMTLKFLSENKEKSFYRKN